MNGKVRQAISDLPEFNVLGHDIDLWWAQILKCTDFVDCNKPLFYQLLKFIKILLVMPYNQAPVERIFSMVGKIDTKFPPTISHDSVCSLLSCEMYYISDCYAVETPNMLIHSAKTATSRYNLELGSKTYH